MVAKYSPPPQKQENMQPETALSNCLHFIHFHRDIVCHYIEICQKMNFQIDHSIPCDTTTVMIWACTGHAVYLCDEHVKSYPILSSVECAHMRLEVVLLYFPTFMCLVTVIIKYFPVIIETLHKYTILHSRTHTQTYL